jgi:hypothetical protein
MDNSTGIELIAELYDNPQQFYDAGKSLLLLHEYFIEFSQEKLRPLFYHDNLFVRRVAIWIASELGSKGGCFIDDAIALLGDDDRYVKHYALEVIAVNSIGDDSSKFVEVIRFLECKDEVICDSAMLLVTNASRIQLEECAKHFGSRDSCSKSHSEGLSELMRIDDVAKEHIEFMKKDDDPIIRRYGEIITRKRLKNHGLKDCCVLPPSSNL